MSYLHMNIDQPVDQAVVLVGQEARVLADVAAERGRQDARWGEQNHPDIDTRDIDIVTHQYYAQLADRWKAVNDERAQLTHSQGRCQIAEPHKHTAWDGILLEEVYEALAEADPVKRRAELVQVAAVAAVWIEDLDRRAVASEATS